MGHCQEVMREKHLLLQRTPLLHFQPFDTTYAGCTYKTKWPWREQQWVMASRYNCLALRRVSQWGVVFDITHLFHVGYCTEGCQDVRLLDLLTLMSQICILVLLVHCLHNTKHLGSFVFSAHFLHCLKLLSSGLSVRQYQGQNVTVNYTSLPPNQSHVPQGQLHCVKFLIHNLVFLANRMKPQDESPLGSKQLFTHDWLKGQNKMVLTGILHAAGHF